MEDSQKSWFHRHLSLASAPLQGHPLWPPCSGPAPPPGSSPPPRDWAGAGAGLGSRLLGWISAGFALILAWFDLDLDLAGFSDLILI